VHLLPDLLDVVRDFFVRVALAVEVAHLFGPVRLGGEEVCEVEAELLCELAHGRMALVDGLAAMLRDLVVRPGRPV
jgi:hypothetical protein